MKSERNPILLIIFFVFIFTGCSQTKTPSLASLYRDSRASKLIKNEKFEEALTEYYRLLEDEPESAATHSNIGVLLNKSEKQDEALKSLNYSLKLAQEQGLKEMIFKARYNLGVFYGAQKKIQEALDNYQAALDIVPDSLEIKTNIELLIQQQQNQQQKGNQEDQKDKNDQQDQSKNDKNKDNKDNKDDKEKKEDQKKQSLPKYQPRPFKGDELSEADVKKILTELKNQEQKIRANFDKKEKKGSTNKNEKDW